MAKVQQEKLGDIAEVVAEVYSGQFETKIEGGKLIINEKNQNKG